jgi:5-methylcytosine-specific restriction endonuclease McrA
MESIRYKVFRQSLSCKHCGLRGEYFAVEKHIHGYDASVENTRYHLNLYARVGDEEILFTKDHILPKSLGGKDDLENLQTLCVKCNHKKGNNIIKDQHLIPWPSKRIKMKMIAEAVKQKKGVVYGGICNVF